MIPRELLELAIIAFILIGIAVAIWKGGARNPVATGPLQSRLSEFGATLTGVQTKVGEIENRVEGLEGKAASAADIARLEVAIAKLAQTLPDIEARQRALSDKMGEHAVAASATATAVTHIEKQVGLIYNVLVTKGMEK